MILTLPTATATRELGRQLGQWLPASSVLLLEGNLGAGKTTLIQGLGEGLGVPEAIDSPTFTLINEYLGGRLPLYHFDLYRLEATEIQDLHPEIYWEGLEVEAGVVAIEWAERLPYLPDSYLRIHLTHTIDGQRQVELTPVGSFDRAYLPHPDFA